MHVLPYISTASWHVYQSSTAHAHQIVLPVQTLTCSIPERPISACLVRHQLAVAASAAETASVVMRPVHEGMSSHLCTWSISASGLWGGHTAGPSLAPAWRDAASGGGDGAECRSTAVNKANVSTLNMVTTIIMMLILLLNDEDDDVVIVIETLWHNDYCYNDNKNYYYYCVMMYRLLLKW